MRLKDRDREAQAQGLDEACPGNPELRSEVEDLLEIDHRNRLGTLSPEPYAAGTLIDRYVVRSCLGTGGMGTVYLVQEEPGRRSVALKLVHAAALTATMASRFRFEGELLHRLKHPGIAQIYGTGTHDSDGLSLPFLVMEYVPAARSLTDYAQEEDLPIAARLDLFVSVCRAVHHAHQKAIIHRDLKPENILIDSEGQPKLIDFGISRTVDTEVVRSQCVTRRGQWLGTPQYMSPEQCYADSVDLDVTCDVYSLGVILYELVCGVPPYVVQGLALHEVSQVICHTAPRPPAEVAPDVSGDLAVIMLKTLEKRRGRCYGSALLLAEDLERYLSGEPIQASAPRLMTRLRSWLRARPRLAGLTGVSLLVFLVLAAMGIFRAVEIVSAAGRLKGIGGVVISRSVIRSCNGFHDSSTNCSSGVAPARTRFASRMIPRLVPESWTFC